MPYAKQHIQIFLAYISDIESEVEAAKEIVESINRSHEQLGIELDLRTWKDVPEDFGNPQQKINREFVEKCDVFIGLVWKKWGTPTGQSTCGFREELDIAERRYNQTGEPTILLYAKAVNEPDIKDDEREGFDKIKEFKDEIVKGHKGFLITFSTIEEWKGIIRERLTQYMIDKYIFTSKIATASRSPQVVPVGVKYEAIEKIKTPKEIQTLIDDLLSHKSKSNFENIEDFNKIRLFILSSAIFYDFNLYEILGNHEIQLLYLHRKKIKPIDLEAKLIFRTIIADRYNLKAGWFWLKDVTDKMLRDYTANHLIDDVNKEVRYGAICFIDNFWLKKYNSQLLRVINDTKDEIKIKALEITATHGDESYLKTIEKHLSSANKDVVKTAWTAKFAILSRINPDAAIKFLQEFEDNRGKLQPYLNQIKDNISDEKLKELTRDKGVVIKEFAYQQLFNRRHLSSDEIRPLTDSDAISLRKFAYFALIELGEKPAVKTIIEKWPSGQGLLSWYSGEQRDLIIGKIYGLYEKAELWEEIEWFSATGHLAYRSYGLRFFDSLEKQIYEDLDTDFKKMKDKYLAKVETQFRSKLSNKTPSETEQTVKVYMEEHLRVLAKYDEFIKNQFIASALNILALKRTSKSLVYARKYSNSKDKDIQSWAVQIIAKYGNLEDVPTLLRTAFESYGSTKSEAVQQVLKYSKFDKTVIQQLIVSGENTVVKACLSYDLDTKSYAMIENAKNLLMHEKDDIRIFALSYLANILTKKALLELLDNYLSGTTYYYDIVCWLDRILFAPLKARSFYKRKLLNKIEEPK